MEISLGQGLENERVVANAPNSGTLLVNCRFGSGCSGDEQVTRVCIAFLGGPDSWEEKKKF